MPYRTRRAAVGMFTVNVLDDRTGSVGGAIEGSLCASFTHHANPYEWYS
ncbi:MAG: hypothetical protein ACXV3U_05780 [Halobacteriota archaeon]